MKKILSLLILTIMVLSCIAPSFADTGVLHRPNDEIKTVKVNENGNQVTYHANCIEQMQNIDDGERVNTRESVRVRDGVIDYIVANWNESKMAEGSPNYSKSARAKFRDDIWKITENSRIGYVNLTDFYKVNKTLESTTKVTTTELIDGKLYNITRWTESFMQFTFRTTGDGYYTEMGGNYDSNRQDLILWITEIFSNSYNNTVLLPSDEPDTPETDPNDENPVNNDNSDDDFPVVENDTTDDDTDGNNPNDNGPGETDNDDTDNLNSNNPQSPGNGNSNSGHSSDIDLTAPFEGSNADAITASAGSAMKNTGVPLVAILFALIGSMGGIVLRRK